MNCSKVRTTVGLVLLTITGAGVGILLTLRFAITHPSKIRSTAAMCTFVAFFTAPFSSFIRACLAVKFFS